MDAVSLTASTVSPMREHKPLQRAPRERSLSDRVSQLRGLSVIRPVRAAALVDPFLHYIQDL